ncbi:membrane fusion protein, cobalt-zinc-cadmium efflux system [Candidatus Kryptonium thompsonii]|nr:membrane fusion protein, cobalt-zinc-cadmium efflux system [Candidatus Kryptonium thompsoni]
MFKEAKFKLKGKIAITFLTAILFTLAILVVLGKNKNEKFTNESIEEPKSKNETNELVLSSDVRSKIVLDFEEVKERPITGMLRVPARLITNQDYEAQVGSLIQGRVSQVFVKEGDFVKAGQVLMLIEGSDIGEVIAAYLQAKSNLEYYKSAYERQKILFEQNVGSQKALQEAKAEYEKAIAEFNAADKKIHSIGLEEKDIEGSGSEHIPGILPIKAPISGIVTERNVVIGQFIEANTTAFKIMNISNLWAEGQIYEKDLTKISGKPKVEFTTYAYPNERFKGEVILIGQIVD